MRDINEKYKIRNEDLLDSLTNFMMDNISNITSIRNITNSLKRADDKLNHKTIGSYIQYLCNTFLFYKVRRYDIQGKRYLESQDKYYLIDPTFKYAKLGIKNMNYGRNYENIVEIDLLRRGYEVRPLLKIKDAYPKIIIARTKHDMYQYEGIQIYDIAKWLAE